ncbi:hypothetical protein SAMN05421877_10640 [Sphingobacterium lactis]|uniref:Uncharacterized protein n=1 Tax=Sphingobacterium lactis TaxID=797291 RepID=A0A1H5YLX6_9SPHI|nr:hypothetical protein SAMN05421877_10640 [Sphingobacterium lactis]
MSNAGARVVRLACVVALLCLKTYPLESMRLRKSNFSASTSGGSLVPWDKSPIRNGILQQYRKMQLLFSALHRNL